MPSNGMSPAESADKLYIYYIRWFIKNYRNNKEVARLVR